MLTVSKRLEKIAGLVPKGARVADIGADHGYLSIFLIKQNIADFVYACDIRPKPLLNAQHNITAANAQNIELRLCDGLEGINEPDIDAAVIAGMGGEVIAGIIDRCNWIKNPCYTLILQPMTSSEELRKYLYINGFIINTEAAVEDENRIYTVLSVKYCGKPYPFTQKDLYIGSLNPKNSTDLIYINKQLNRLQKCCDDIKNIATKQAEFLCLEQTIHEITEFIGGK